jgi:hypothetical protein
MYFIILSFPALLISISTTNYYWIDNTTRSTIGIICIAIHPCYEIDAHIFVI